MHLFFEGIQILNHGGKCVHEERQLVSRVSRIFTTLCHAFVDNDTHHGRASHEAVEEGHKSLEASVQIRNSCKRSTIDDC